MCVQRSKFQQPRRGEKKEKRKRERENSPGAPAVLFRAEAVKMASVIGEGVACDIGMHEGNRRCFLCIIGGEGGARFLARRIWWL